MIDFEMGAIMDGARAGILDDTAVFFCADHGEFTGSHCLNDRPDDVMTTSTTSLIAHIPGVSTGRSDGIRAIDSAGHGSRHRGPGHPTVEGRLPDRGPDARRGREGWRE